MKSFIACLVALFLGIGTATAERALPDQRASCPSAIEMRQVSCLVPDAYQRDVLKALRQARGNARELMSALQRVSGEEREGMAFLIANMPREDLRKLKADLLIDNIRFAYKARAEVPWGLAIPKDIFLNDVLPYASVNERRDNWRGDFYGRFMGLARQGGTIRQAVAVLNKAVFDELKVSYDAVKRIKPEQSPYESMEIHYASCTGLSVILVDALRAVGIPARIVGTALWADNSGNHTWVEVWDGEWHHIGAAEPGELDQAWFTSKAATADSRHPIYAVSFRRTGLFFPMAWARGLKVVPAVDVTRCYGGA